MTLRHAAPIMVPPAGSGGPAAILTPLATDSHGFAEADIQDLIQQYPRCLPILEIDPLFRDPVPVCTELNTAAGPIDNFMVTPSGLPVLVECKLWKNPEARREVVGQILDYAKELSSWTSSDVQREVSRRLKREGNVVLDLVRAAGHEVEETDFNDALSLNLRRGRFLLLIVGDGIRQGVEAIAQYLQGHAGLHFTLGLVELPIFLLPDGGRVVVPRVLARSEKIVRTVVEAPDGFSVEDDSLEGVAGDGPLTPQEQRQRQEALDLRRAECLEFWTAFLSGLRLDDPEQPVPKASRGTTLSFMMPAPGGSSWISVYRAKYSGNVGVFLSATKNSPGERAALSLARDQDELRAELGEQTSVRFSDDSYEISEYRPLHDFSPSPERDEVFAWLRQRTNDFVNALRPRIKAAIAELES